MSEAKFAKGPWALRHTKKRTWVRIDALNATMQHWALAKVVWRIEGDERSPTQEANAHLIAAAPDLYEALVETLAVAVRNEEGDFADKARAALAKARGES